MKENSAGESRQAQTSAAFVGHFSPEADWNKKGTSIPGDQVQRQIIDDLRHHLGDGNVYCYSMLPEPSWPRGRLFYSGCIERTTSGVYINFLPYVNIFIFKNLCFSVFLLINLIKIKPSLSIQYNSYLFENISLMLARWAGFTNFITLIIQDIYAIRPVSFTKARYWRSKYEQIGLHFVKHFNLVVPVSVYIAQDFGLADNRTIIFPGGVTTEFLNISNSSYNDINPSIAVYAGALSAYNGVDLIVREWVDQSIPYELHIFGKGPLSGYVTDMALNNSSIIFHGLQPASLVSQFQSRANWNFCFRFSKDIDQRYFFPSKIFGLLLSPGITIINRSFDIPDSLSQFTYVADDGLIGLAEVLKQSESINSKGRVDRRRDFVLENYRWRSLIGKILLRAQDSGHRI